ncbi:complement component C6 isoform X1 [Danio rerio]|uniref:Complement component C6 isoform X1 n=8 Tax=Danio rerio TaxID=7955 RepID=A0AB32T8B6_DANRE
MDCTCILLALLSTLASLSPTMGCFCDHYPWSTWSQCTKTCDSGTQSRLRAVQYDDHWLKNSCSQLCQIHDNRVCNVEACPINCQLTEFGPWSECSSCAKKSFKIRSVLRPSQFEGANCSQSLMEERACHPFKECRIEPLDCKDKFTCDTGRCIHADLQCNDQNDCGDNSDERDCGRIKSVCSNQRMYAFVPGADQIGFGYDAAVEQMRGAVLDNSFMGSNCTVEKLKRNCYRISANIERYELKIETFEDFQQKETKSQKIDLAKEPLYREAVKASQQKDSVFYRVDQVIVTATFKVKSSDLYLSDQFLQFLSSLPLEYNYALYRHIFQLFGTHYFSSGTLGGKYELLFQFDREELKTFGLKESDSEYCLSHDDTLVTFFYNRHSQKNTCGNISMKTKYEGSMVKASKICITSVQGGDPYFAAALAWEKNCVSPASPLITDWIKSTIKNPVVIHFELLPLVNLVRGISCAVTKRRHFQRALEEYQTEFDSCKCAPCPNNAWPALSGTECLCICQTGTYGSNCEKRAPDYTSVEVDGHWSCWSCWSPCDATLKKHRSRTCSNPAPQRGGTPCPGLEKQVEECTISFFQEQNVCINDDSESRLPSGTSGCAKPLPPANSHLRFNKRQYDYGELEEIICFTGFELQGFQLIHCLQDGTWEKPKAQCINKPYVPDSSCKPGEINDGTKCVCMTKERCRGYREDLCVYDAGKETAIMMSLCAFHVDRCHGDRLYFMNNGPCKSDARSLDWAKFRVSVSEQSSVQEPCGSDTCYEWETCSVSKTCECKMPRECPKDGKKIYCLKIVGTQTTRSMNLCFMAVMKCSSIEFELQNEGPCAGS